MPDTSTKRNANAERQALFRARRAAGVWCENFDFNAFDLSEWALRRGLIAHDQVEDRQTVMAAFRRWLYRELDDT